MSPAARALQPTDRSISMSPRIGRRREAVAAFGTAAGFTRSPGVWVLALMLVVDVALIQLHRLSLQDVVGGRFSMEIERSVPEYYQHAKELFAAVLAGALFLSRGDRLHAWWAALFAYLFVDDAFEVHEGLGRRFTAGWDTSSILGVDPQPFAELMVSGAAGLIFLVALPSAWRRSGPAARQLGLQLIGALLLLVAFGVAIDALHAFVPRGPWSYRLGIIEDGGELVAMTLLLWLTMTHAISMTTKLSAQ